MKIEIGESLALSYLKHVEKCVLYQTNWKSSSQWDIEEEWEKEVGGLFEKMEKHKPFENVFKGSSFEQVIKQAEIDALGMGQDGKIYAVDIAYHERGLNYKDAPKRVAKKMLRSYLVLLLYFPDREYEIIFTSPKVKETLGNKIKEAIEEVKTFCADQPKVKFTYLANDEFEDKILKKTIKDSKGDADMAELFMRSYKLWRLFDQK